MNKTVLVTGGLGFIGSHTVVELINSGYKIVIIDSLRNSELMILDQLNKISGEELPFYQEDVCNEVALAKIFNDYHIDVVIHFAADKSVNESKKNPLKYFSNNINSLLSVIRCMKNAGCTRLVFSSSATVYGQPDILPVIEESPFQTALTAYGSTKQMGEEILRKTTEAGSHKAIALRYFNPVGAHDSGLIGELPKGVPNNLFPYVMQTAIGQLPQLTVHGDDYPTPDGSCLRDYIHVVDLAIAHVKACERLISEEMTDWYEVYNIGTGKATSVLEVIKTFETVCKQSLNYVIGKRREGDVASVYANTSKANNILRWKAQKSLNEMVASAWKWTCADKTI